MRDTISFTVNGTPHTLTTDTDRPLLEVLREDLHLTGTKFGCGEAQCGACSVLVDDRRLFSCVTAVKTVAGKSITTIEGLAKGDVLHPVQQAFLDEGAYQCGYCIAGMIVTAAGLLKSKPHPSDEEIIAGMNHNICRCSGYPKILAAVKRASA